jgi:hypothetical protein
MKPKLYQRVALIRDWPDAGLRRGDVATVVDWVPHPTDGDEGCVLEVFNALGESIQVVTVPSLYVSPVTSDDIPAIRRLVVA